MADPSGLNSVEIERISDFLFNTLMDAKGAVLKEYDLIASCMACGLFDFLPASSSTLNLYRKHYLVMNTLYALRPNFAREGQWLTIGPLEIYITELDNLSESVSLARSDMALGHYYSDWAHYENATDETVDRLLADFWLRFERSDQRLPALEYFDLNEDSSWQDIQKAYRRFASKYHPDNGGDAAVFIEAREKYLVLKGCFLESS